MATELAFKLEEKDVTEKALSLIDQAGMVKIADSKSYEVAGFLWKTIGEVMKEVKETFDPIVDAAFKAHKKACEQRSKYFDPLAKAQKSVKGLMSEWDWKQEAIRLAEQKRLEEIARKEEEERRIEEAILAEEEAKANGATPQEAAQEADAIINEPVYVPPVVLPKETPKVSGLSFRTIWKFRIKDVNVIPRQYMVPDEKAIGAVVRSSQGRIRIAGVEPYEERV
jgi:hypothetical protein